MSNDEIRIAEEALCNISFDIEIEKQLHISAFVENEEHFKDWETTFPFFLNVRKEGGEIHAE